MTTLRPHLVLATCCLSLFLVTVDSTIMNVALPALRRELHASAAGLQWSIDGYTVVVASFLMLAGSMADRFGRRRTFQVGLAVFIRRLVEKHRPLDPGRSREGPLNSPRERNGEAVRSRYPVGHMGTLRWMGQRDGARRGAGSSAL